MTNSNQIQTLSEDEIYNKAVANLNANMPIITGTIFKNHVIDPYATYCEFFVNSKFKDKQNEFGKFISDKGKKLEQEYYAENSVMKLNLKLNLSDFKEAIKIMKQGIPLLGQVPILFGGENIGGITDVLVRDDSHPSYFGSFHYKVKEMKYSDNLEKKKYYIYQCAFYNYILGLIQGYCPPTIYLIGYKKQETAFQYMEKPEEIVLGPDPDDSILNKSDKIAYEDEIKEKIQEIRDIIAGKTKSFNIKYDGCKKTYKWNNYCNSVYDKLNPITSTLRKFRYTFPNASKRVYLDIEHINWDGTSPTGEPIVYLITACVKSTEGEFIKSFKVKKGESERKIIEDFAEFLKELGDDHIVFHHQHTERTVLSKKMREYGVDEALVNDYETNKCFDTLTKVARPNSACFPTRGNGLKEICKCLGFKWRSDKMNGQESVAYYNKYYDTGDESILNEIADYNEDDVLALKHFVEWVEK